MTKYEKYKNRYRIAPSKEDVLLIAPKDYCGLQDISDDYDLAAKMILKGQEHPQIKKKIDQAIDGEDLRPYGPATNYKSAYTYNRSS